MIDWKQSLPTIIAAIIGSGLIVTGFSTLGSIIFRPIVGISVDTYPLHDNVQTMNYTISLKNTGFTPATHLRLTISYPGAKIFRTIVNHEDENMTVKNESEGTSVVAFLPRLTPGAGILVNASIYRNQADYTNKLSRPLADYSSNKLDYSYSHYQPYSVIATYDQGSTQFTPNAYDVSWEPIYTSPLQPLYTPLILIALAFLSFGIAFRHKRRGRSKLASDILKDIMKVRDELVNDDKGDPSGIVLRLHTWQSNADNERQIVSDYRDYQKIDDFYSTVKSRNCYLLQNQVSNDILSILNQDCVNKATIIYTEIDWRKFHKLDLLLLIPAIVLGSILMFLAYDGMQEALSWWSGTINGNIIPVVVHKGHFVQIRLPPYPHLYTSYSPF